MATCSGIKKLLAGLFLIWSSFLNAQLRISNGVCLPSRDTLRILVVFAEVDYSEANCPGGFNSPGFHTDWPVEDGVTLIPERASAFLDPIAKEISEGMISYFYHKASFGSYVITGDYLGRVVSLPCKKVKPRSPMVNEVLEIIDSLDRSIDGGIRTLHGFPLTHFDQWTMTMPGVEKRKAPDGNVDLLYVIWRNNRYLFGMSTLANSGYGVVRFQGRPFAGMSGVNSMASFNNGSGIKQAFHITIAEHLHGIFGGNEWHTAGGVGKHSTLAMGLNYGITAQLLAPMLSVSAWDRYMMDWKNPHKRYLLSGLSTEGLEIPTDFFGSPDAAVQEIWLRDFISSGDAIRIRLPFPAYKKPGDPKNQYIWLEYRRMEDRIDMYLDESLSCVNNGNGLFPRGSPGIYAYYQVGKDQKEGDQSIYSYFPEHPNGLAGYLIPISAEGRYDIVYRRDLQQAPLVGSCSWGNPSIPIDRDAALPNPLTGQHDLWQVLDQNEDGKLYHGDTVQAGHTELIGDSIVWNFFAGGDYKDAFSFHSRQTKFTISSNPAPTPIYTLTTDYSNKRVSTTVSSYENRTIYLNGISVTLLEEGTAPDGSPGMKLRIEWDNFNISGSLRWCGNICLPAYKGKGRLELKSGARLLLDRGESPQFGYGKRIQGKGWDFSENTNLRIDSGAVLRLQPGSRLFLRDSSTLEIMPNARLEIERKARIQKDATSRILIHPGAEIKNSSRWPISP
jgi:hypothetical protein